MVRLLTWDVKQENKQTKDADQAAQMLCCSHAEKSGFLVKRPISISHTQC